MYMMPVLYACVGACVHVSGVCVFAFRGQRGAKECVRWRDRNSETQYIEFSYGKCIASIDASHSPLFFFLALSLIANRNFSSHANLHFPPLHTHV